MDVCSCISVRVRACVKTLDGRVLSLSSPKVCWMQYDKLTVVSL